MATMEFDPEALPIPALGLRCRQCEYLLDGLPRHVCPECGWTFRMDDMVPLGDWIPVVSNGRFVTLTNEVNEMLRRARVLFQALDRGFQTLYGGAAASGGPMTVHVTRGDYLYVLWLLQDPSRVPPPEPPGPDWTCGHCGERNPGTFESCWSCGR